MPDVLPVRAGSSAATDLDRVRLRPGTVVLDRGDGEVQLGTDPRWALRLAGLDRAEVAWLRDLAARRHAGPAAAAARHGVADERRDEIAAVLRRGGFLQRPGGAADHRAETGPDAGTADAPVLGALLPDGGGLAVVAARGRRTAAVAGLGRLGAAVALHLATAGVGTLVAADRSPVQVTDLGLGGYEAEDVGRPRAEALRERLRRAAPRARVLDDGTPEVAVLVESRAAAPARYGRLVAQGVAHLPVVVREADVVVGPFVLPGVTACARCADLRRSDADPAWPALAAQLRELVEAPQETTLAAAAAALAAAQVLAHLDGLRPAAAGALLEVALPEAVPRAAALGPHPRCGCTTLSPSGGRRAG
ncbi:ThiF family adenylyltransferase [Puerhibacterium sp. TATVAM-FAB25]|uniref:ThiF family adenylyltransferase n=1 Tax=Puerhibacterium sp. TATVAM-FAB25 TaxID=3093699 RepID=UPI0039784549